MHKDLQSILDFIQQSAHLNDEEKKSLAKSLKDANKEFEITSFKLDRTEKVKRTTAILLEETIEELEKKRKAVEAQNKELEIESSLERVRTVAMSMNEPDDMLHVCRTISEQLELLKVKEIRNVQTAIFYEEKGSYMNYEYYTKHNQTFITNTTYTDHKIQQEFAEKMLKGNGEFMTAHINADELKEWVAYQKTTNVFIDDYLNTAFSLDYYWFSLGPVALGISAYVPLADEQINLFKRFLKVFELSYRRYLDIEKAEAQAREAQIEAALEQVRSRSLAMHKSEDIIEVARSVFEKLDALGVELNTAFIIVFKNDSRDSEWWLINRDDQHYSKVFVKYTDLAIVKEQFDARDQGKEIISATYFAEEKNRLFEYLFTETDFKYAPPERKKYIFESNALTLSMGLSSKIGIQITRHINKPFSNEENEILKRFTKVFDQSYTRFLDLQKAEAQAKEARIEAALERVRAVAMSMMKPDDLLAICKSIYTQLPMLGFTDLRAAQIYIRNDEEEKFINYDYSDDAGSDVVEIKYNSHPYTKSIYDVIRNAGDGLVDNTIEKKELEEWKSYLYNTLGQKPEKKLEAAEELHYYLYSFGIGAFGICTFKTINKDELEILKRFRNVFSLSYQRYSDIALAEAQAREAKIELSLERVRAKTMAMHNSQDVGDTVAVMFDEVMKLGIETIRCGIGIMHEPGEMEIWTAKPDENGNAELIIGRMDMMMHPLLQGAFNGWRNKQEFYTYELIGDDLIDYFTVINNHPDYPVKYDIASLPSKIFHSEFHFPEGTLFVFSLKKLSAETLKIFKRFAGVFGQTYRRYLDLKKAEAQAIEARIEASLERVRSKAMAMHSSKDLTDTIIAFYRELESLSVTPRRCGVGLINRETHVAEISSMNTTEQGDSIAVIGNLDLKIHPILKGIYDNWISQKDYYPVLRGSEIKEYYQILTPQIHYPDYPNDVVQYGYFFFFAEGGVYAWTEKQMTENEVKIYKRFTSVLTLTYKRYKDLKQAEEQAREATMEAALERVRGKALAMHNSSDLPSAAGVLFTELRKLGIHPIRCGVGLLNKETRKVQLYSATSGNQGDSLSLVGWIILSNHPVAEKIYDAWLQNEDYYPVLSGEELKSYYENLLLGFSLPSIPDLESGQKQYGTFLPASIGCLYAWSETPYNEAEIKILKRFAAIIDLTFRRYIELQKSEANTREAVKQAALDRVRADIASMRTTNDLERITPLIWNELTVLGIPFIRSGVFIMDNEQQQIHTFLSSPDGKAIAAFHIPFDTPGNITQVLNHWQQKENYIDHWDEKAFTDFADTLVKQGALASPEQYLQTMPHGGFHLHFLPFLQGMLYVGNSKRLGDEEIKLVQSIADAFSTAYARYEDFNKLEAAKQTVEKTLTDLKQAQAQLVQSEKMASLGELTAGIAHEIQNPLNFVNNFSEVSNELIEELKEERNKEQGARDAELENDILNDIAKNLEKINHHGKRADAIVKGMLQHSRSSTNAKEPTNINVLADEYLRLAYHGLRGKDKSFNAIMKTDFDEAIGNINIIPQDIGRVLLNLYNNAFYAVSERKKVEGLGYEPTISVSTKKIKNQVFISVSDNGNGIPQKIVDKIFQPFFTTKPTGQGTGLGLSLSYDIIKAHGGEIKVETNEGEGTIFIIQLPIM